MNDTPEHLAKAVELSGIAHASVFTGLFYRSEIAQYYKDNGLPEPYGDTARRKIVPEELEERILDAFAGGKGGPLFPQDLLRGVLRSGRARLQRALRPARGAVRHLPATAGDAVRVGSPHADEESLRAIAARLPEAQGLRVIDISERAAVVTGLDDEQPRYFLQHALGFQIHDHRHPHRPRRHGRADIGWDTDTGEGFRVTETPWNELRYLVVDVEGS